MLLFLALAGGSGFATEIEPMDAEAVSANAPLVVTAYVTATRLVQDVSGVAEYEATLKVLNELRGTAGAPMLRVRLRVSLVHFDRLLEPGDSGVFFLKPTEHGQFEAQYPGSFALFQLGVVRDPSVE